MGAMVTLVVQAHAATAPESLAWTGSAACGPRPPGATHDIVAMCTTVWGAEVPTWCHGPSGGTSREPRTGILCTGGPAGRHRILCLQWRACGRRTGGALITIDIADIDPTVMAVMT